MPKCCQSAGLQSYMTSSGQTLYEQIVTINIKSGSLCGLIRLESLPPRRKKYCLKDEQFLWPRFCFMCRGNCKWIITQYHIRMHKRHASFHNSTIVIVNYFFYKSHINLIRWFSFLFPWTRHHVHARRSSLSLSPSPQRFVTTSHLIRHILSLHHSSDGFLSVMCLRRMCPHWVPFWNRSTLISPLSPSKHQQRALKAQYHSWAQTHTFTYIWRINIKDT